MNQSDVQALYRAVPSVDRLLKEPEITLLNTEYDHRLVKKMIHKALDELRREIKDGVAQAQNCLTEEIIERIKNHCRKAFGPKLTRVINATGVIVHTNLGRSPLSHKVATKVAEIAQTYSNLEYDLEKGRRGERNSHLRNLMIELTGAESAIAVNNNAAAVLLALSSLASGKEVVVSRGELIEIGGSFRIPDVMIRSGAILKEVGTTNRTHAKDYRNAINENTALILKVHTSNYRIVGFTKELALEELVEIGQEFGIPTMMDLGSGCLVDLSQFGLQEEVTVQNVISKGIDVVSFSGDKLLGGPQAGILAGKADLIETMRTNPLTRALRMDKMTLAALEATLEEYAHAASPFDTIPTLKMISKTNEELRSKSDELAKSLSRLLNNVADISIEKGVGRVGGGALPMSDLPGPRIAIHPRNQSAAHIEQRLRKANPPVIVLVKDECILLDVRTLFEEDMLLLPHILLDAITT